VENERGLRSRAIRLRRARVAVSERVCAAARAEQGARRAYLRPGDGARAFLDRDRDALRARAEADVASDAVTSAVREQALVARVARPKVDLGLAHALHAQPVDGCLGQRKHGKNTENASTRGPVECNFLFFFNFWSLSHQWPITSHIRCFVAHQGPPVEPHAAK
jgi:hypothetical protein